MLRWLIVGCLCVPAIAANYRGQVLFNGMPVPGAVVTVTREGASVSTVTDQGGTYSFPDLANGEWKVRIAMFGFVPTEGQVSIETPSLTTWELKMLPLDRIQADLQSPVSAPPIRVNKPGEPAPRFSAAEETTPDELNGSAADGFLINGSINNGAASPFSQAAAFGNNRNRGTRLYNGGIGFTFDNSTLDAKPFSLSGQPSPNPDYNRMTGLLTFGGPVQIPRLFKNGPNVFAGYQWTRNSSSNNQAALVPTGAQRSGSFPNAILDPLTAVPFPGDSLPQSRIDRTSRSLLGLYPWPNVDNGGAYNYQVPVLSGTNQDTLQSRFNQILGRNDQLFGRFAFQNTRSSAPNLFGFLDTTRIFGLDISANWSHRISREWFLNAGYEFSRYSTRILPFFANRENISGEAGMMGNNQDPLNWGPPSLTFASGIATLSDAQSSFDRNQTGRLSYSVQWNHGSHTVTVGGDLRRQQFNYLAQQDPRGTLTFTGVATGSDFADFLLGVPATTSIAFGNADKYFRQSVYDAYLTDDWRINSEFSANVGLRWEYEAPITELFGRLVNLETDRNFSTVAPVVAQNPLGTVTGQRYPNSLVRSNKRNFQPRVGMAWRPRAGSSVVVRAGYGIYYDTSVYQNIALQMAQQSPLSKTLRAQNSASDPFTLSNAFQVSAGAVRNTFAVDPNFRIGYAQNWQVSIQADAPASLQVSATYLGIKGTRGAQQFLPNTYPAGIVSPCPTCPAGFAFLASNGNSTREAAQLQLRRRLHSGLAASVQYTFSKSIDDVAYLGGQSAPSNTASGASQSASSSQNPFSSSNSGSPGSGTSSAPRFATAQNWLDLSAERGLSTFDQRHLITVQLQYTSGMGTAGGTLLSGRKPSLLREWTFAAQFSAGSGLPQTPVYLAPVNGTGVTGTIRPDYTGASPYASSGPYGLNPAAYSAPLPGQWGNAGRNSITGPSQFTLNASLGRTFRLSDRLNLDLRVDSVNPLNRVTFTAWNTTVNNVQFGFPVAANTMRSLQTTMRLRF
jgi:trimeric autotransporter adhesin